MKREVKWVLPMLGRAGLGNELFPLLRALDIAIKSDAGLLPPRWMQPRIGPLLRGERDPRAYWRLFKRVSVRARLRELVTEFFVLIGDSIPPVSRLTSKVHVERGMEGHFKQLVRPGVEYRLWLEHMCRDGVLSKPIQGAYWSFHIRLGDFQRSGDESRPYLSVNNTSAPMSWYVQTIHRIRERFPTDLILISSDGSDEELSEVLELLSVERTSAKNALDEMMILSRARGIVGSRSTFSSWGAFLGSVPLFLPRGGNAYPPHDDVWEDSDPEAFRIFQEQCMKRICSPE